MTAVLTVVGGLPGTGKSTIASRYAEQSGTPYLRVDRIEQAIVDWSPLSHPLGPVGYAIAHALAREQLDAGLDVLVECVNPSALTRDGWAGTASAAGAVLLEVEVVCSDPGEHRRRIETRPTDVDGLVKPDWEAVLSREYEPWTRQHLVLDSALTAPAAAVQQVSAMVQASRSAARPSPASGGARPRAAG